MPKKCQYPHELKDPVCLMCKDRPDGWSVKNRGGRGIPIGKAYAREDGAVVFIPGGMFGGMVDGEPVCKICLTLYVDEDPWDATNRYDRERQEAWEAKGRRRLGEPRKAEEAD